MCVKLPGANEQYPKEKKNLNNTKKKNGKNGPHFIACNIITQLSNNLNKFIDLQCILKMQSPLYLYITIYKNFSIA